MRNKIMESDPLVCVTPWSVTPWSQMFVVFAWYTPRGIILFIECTEKRGYPSLTP